MIDEYANRHVPLDVADRRPAWVRALTLAITVAATVVILAACNRGGQDHGPGGGFPPALVAVKTVKPITVAVRFEFVGQTAGSKEAEVRARVQGILERRAYQEGGRVKAGQLLFVIDPRPYAAQLQAAEADLARAEEQSSQASRNLERVKPLAGSFDTVGLFARCVDDCALVVGVLAGDGRSAPATILSSCAPGISSWICSPTAVPTP